MGVIKTRHYQPALGINDLGLALLGWLATLPFKKTRAIPLGPWLALGFLVAALFYQPIVKSPFVSRTVAAADYLLGNNSQPWRLEIQP